MKSGRTALCTLLIVGTLAMSPPVATQPRTTYRVGFMTSASPESQAHLQTFRVTLRKLGYVEGANLILDVRTVDTSSQLPALVAELLALQPDVLVGWESSAQVMRAKTTSIPIVLTGAIDPVRAGLACPSALLFRHRDLLFANAVRLGIPFTSFIVANVHQGVLFAYSSSRHEELQKAALYVDRILKGAKPGVIE